MLPAVPFMVYAAGMYLPRSVREWWFRPSLLVPAGIFTLALPALILTECVCFAFDNLTQGAACHSVCVGNDSYC